MSDADPRDFFISYTSDDEPWAEWIAWQLEAAGYTVHLQAWDFVAGTNWALEMQRGTQAERTIIVLSPRFLEGIYTQPEWAAAFGDDPTGAERKLVPVRIAACEPTGLLKQLVYVDLVGKSEAEAKKELLRQLQDRLKPSHPPAYPGGVSTPYFPGQAPNSPPAPSGDVPLRRSSERQAIRSPDPSPATTQRSTVGSADQGPSLNQVAWLHLSDLHFRGSDAERETVLRELVQDAAMVREVVGRLDFVLVTGDIAYSGQPKEYERAARWLDEVAAAVGVSRAEVFVVPGNHDVDRSLAQEPLSKIVHRTARESPEKELGALLEARDVGPLWTKLETYALFATQYGGPALHAKAPYFVHTLPTGLGPVTLGGLNTALLACDDQDSNRTLAIGERQITDVVDLSPRDSLLFILQHHPASWLADGARLNVRRARRASIAFTGHLHAAGGDFLTSFSDTKVITLRAGATHLSKGEQGAHAYAFGALDKDGLSYWPRVWSSSRGQFVADEVNFVLEDARQHWPREALPDALRAWLPEPVEKPEPEPIPEPESEPVLPVGSDLTISDVFTTLIELDREEPWRAMLNACNSDDHLLVALRAERRQRVGLLLHRARRVLSKTGKLWEAGPTWDEGPENRWSYRPFDLPLARQDCEPPDSAEGWLSWLTDALGGGGRPQTVIEERLDEGPVLITVGPVRIDRMADDVWTALAQMLTVLLPKQVPVAQDSSVLRVVVALEYRDAHPERNDEVEDQWAEAIEPVEEWQYRVLPPVPFPDWAAHVKPYLERRFRPWPKDKTKKVMARCKRIYRRYLCPDEEDHQDFDLMCRELDRVIGDEE